MSEENTQEKERNKVLGICWIVLLLLFVLSVCILHLTQSDGGNDRSIGGFLDLSPDFGRNTKFVIIGGRVFYPTKEAVNYTFPKEQPCEYAVEKTDDASGKTITLQQVGPDAERKIIDDPNIRIGNRYKITRYLSGDNRSKDYRDEVNWIELLTVSDDDKTVWTQDAQIDLFRNEKGKIADISPGMNGYFRFQLNNKSGEPVHAVLSIDEPDDGIHLPMIFTLAEEDSGNVSPEKTLGKDGTVELEFDMAKDSSQLFRLQWKWPYESGDDPYDTSVGYEGGRYVLNTRVYAETID